MSALSTPTHPSDSWRCTVCRVVNNGSVSVCESCEASRDGAQPVSAKSAPTPAGPSPAVTFAPKFFSSISSASFGFGRSKEKSSENSVAPSSSQSSAAQPAPLIFGLPGDESGVPSAVAPVTPWSTSATNATQSPEQSHSDRSAQSPFVPSVPGNNIFFAQAKRFLGGENEKEISTFTTAVCSPHIPFSREGSAPSGSLHNDEQLSTTAVEDTPVAVLSNRAMRGATQKRSRDCLELTVATAAAPEEEIIASSPDIVKRQRLHEVNIAPSPTGYLLPPGSPVRGSSMSLLGLSEGNQRSEASGHSPKVACSQPRSPALAANAATDSLLRDAGNTSMYTPLRARTPSELSSVPSSVASSGCVELALKETQASSMAELAEAFQSKPPQDLFDIESATAQAGSNRYSFGVPEELSKRQALTEIMPTTIETPDGRRLTVATPTFGSIVSNVEKEEETLVALKLAAAGTKFIVTETTIAPSDDQELEEATTPEEIWRPYSNDEAGGVVYTWGSGECDQLAVGDSHLNEFRAMPSPYLIVKLRKHTVAAICCGALHSVALLDDGSVVTWGCNDDAVLGRQAELLERLPGRVEGLPTDDPVTAISCGDSHTAVITKKGNSYVWGSYRDSGGILGFPNMDEGKGVLDKKCLTPTLIKGLDGRCVRIASGENHTAVLCLTMEGITKPYLWGSGEFGQLVKKPLADFDSDKSQYLFPQLLTEESLPGIITNIFCGRATSFFECRNQAGTPRYFGVGRNSCGELGIATSDQIVDTCTEITRLASLETYDICGCQFASLALTEGDKVFTWGKKGYLGQTSDADVLSPKPLEGLGPVLSIGAGGDTMFCVLAAGQLCVWGEGQMFQIGDGKEYANPVPDPVKLNPKSFQNSCILQATGGSQHSLALVFNGNYLKGSLNDSSKMVQHAAPSVKADEQFEFPKARYDVQGPTFGYSLFNYLMNKAPPSRLKRLREAIGPDEQTQLTPGKRSRTDRPSAKVSPATKTPASKKSATPASKKTMSVAASNKATSASQQPAASSRRTTRRGNVGDSAPEPPPSNEIVEALDEESDEDKHSEEEEAMSEEELVKEDSFVVVEVQVKETKSSSRPRRRQPTTKNNKQVVDLECDMENQLMEIVQKDGESDDDDTAGSAGDAQPVPPRRTAKKIVSKKPPPSRSTTRKMAEEPSKSKPVPKTKVTDSKGRAIKSAPKQEELLEEKKTTRKVTRDALKPRAQRKDSSSDSLEIVEAKSKIVEIVEAKSKRPSRKQPELPAKEEPEKPEKERKVTRKVAAAATRSSSKETRTSSDMPAVKKEVKRTEPKPQSIRSTRQTRKGAAVPSHESVEHKPEETSTTKAKKTTRSTSRSASKERPTRSTSRSISKERSKGTERPVRSTTSKSSSKTHKQNEEASRPTRSTTRKPATDKPQTKRAR